MADPLLLQLRSDRRLGHEWDDWDGEPLPSEGDFEAREGAFFALAALLGGGVALALLAVAWLLGPRIESLIPGAAGVLYLAVLAGAVAWGLWVAAIGAALRTGRNPLPARLAEKGLLPWVMPALVASGRLIGLSRDRAGNALLRVYNRLAGARAGGCAPSELLILLPRCLGKEAMRAAMSVSERYGVPLFVASRGRYAREMIASRRPRGVVAVACERDLVSGIHDVASRLPVLGTTIQLPDGPCRNTTLQVDDLERQVRSMLGLEEGVAVPRK